jgi:hypothetical protein
MRNRRLISTGLAVAFAAAAAACSNEMQAPEQQTTMGERSLMTPTTVSGCLKVGLDENTFVLMAREGSSDTATYQLTGANDINLRAHVDRHVEVTGTLRAEQEFAGAGRSVEDDKAKGTAGTPVVETTTEVKVKRLVVNEVKPTGKKCAD